MKRDPIGILDSGSGGLSVLLSIQKLLPRESLLYIGDHNYAPYGDKSTEFITMRVTVMIEYLLRRRVKLVIVACNTATIAGIDYFRKRFPGVPIVGVVPVVKTAAQISRTKHFVVLSTRYTATSHYQRQLIWRFAPDCTVESIGSSRLVPLIEEGKIDSEEVAAELRRLLKRIDKSSCDVIALGCTHYPFLTPMVRAIVGEKVTILDSGDAVARQVKRVLTNRQEVSDAAEATQRYVTSGNARFVASVFRRLLKRNVAVAHVTL